MRELLKPLLIVSLVLAVPVLPFVLAGDWMEAAIGKGVRRAEEPELLFALVVGVLAVDVFLPVPSSGVGTVAGAKLGTVQGAFAVWIGTTAGAAVGFGLARWFGLKIATRLVGRQELRRLRRPALRWGGWLLLITRPLPLVAEATVLLLGTMRLPWAAFWWPVTTANLILAICYAALGEVAHRHGWLTPAIVIALVLPLLAAWLVRRRLPAPHR